MITASRLPLLAHCPYPGRPDVRPPRLKPSPGAERGTVRHEVLATLVLGDLVRPEILARCDVPDPLAFERRVRDWIETHVPEIADAEVPYAYDPATDSARELTGAAHRDYSAARPGEICGTADVVWIDALEGRAHVLDWKTGWGEVDPVRENRQLRALGLFAARAAGVSEARIVIAHVGDDGTVRTEEDTLGWAELEEVAIELEALSRLVTQEPKPVAGPHCTRYRCPWIGYCGATIDVAGELAPSPLIPINGSITRLPTYPFVAHVTSQRHAQWSWERIKLAKVALERIEEAVRAWVDEHGPVPLEGGRELRRVERQGAEKIDPEAIPLELAERLAREYQGLQVSLVPTSKTAIVKLLGQERAESLLAALREAGAVTRGEPSVRYEEVRT